MTQPYYVIDSNPEQIFDAATDGYIAPDGNAMWLDYLAWRDEGNEPDVRPDPIAERRASGISKLMGLGLTEEEARAIAGT